MEVIDRLVAAVEASGLKRVRIADAAGISPTKLSKILNGKQVPTVPEFIAIARAIRYDPARLFTEGELVIEVETLREAHAASQRLQEILAGWLPATPSASASRLLPKQRLPDRSAAPIRAAADPNAELIAELETERKLIPRRAWNRSARIIARVVGSSMDGGTDPIRDGELAYLKPIHSPRTANHRIVLLRREDGLYLKKLEISGHTVRLISTNDEYDPLEVDARAENLQIYGYVVDHRPEEP